MWVALFTAMFAPAPVMGLLACIVSFFKSFRNNRPTWKTGTSMALFCLILLGRRWIHLLRPKSDDEPYVLAGEVHTAFGVDGTRLEWEELGPVDAPGILLVHGWSLTHDSWYYQKKALSHHYRVVFYDMRGNGRSEVPANRDYSIETLVSDLNCVYTDALLNLQPGGCALVGHSLGAMILPLFVARYGESSQNVRCIASIAGTDSPLLETMRGRGILRPMRRWFWEPLARSMGHNPRPYEWVARFLWEIGSIHMALMFGMHVGKETRGQDDLIARRCGHFSMAAAGLGAQSSFSFDARRDMQSISMPVLLMTGESDRNMPPEIQHAMASRLKNARVVIIPDCGHLGILECHREINAELNSFLCENLDDASLPLFAQPDGS